LITVPATESSTSSRTVREGLAAADRLRRSRAASRTLWRVAPLVAGVVLASAAVAFGARWPAAVPLGLVAAGLVGLAAYALLSRRRQPVSDAAAAVIDADAGLAGELRSAAWFAARGTGDEWAQFHLDTAAAGLARVDWRALYPRVRARRAQAITAALTLAAVALSLTIPDRVGVGPGLSAAPRDGRAPGAAGKPGQPMLLTPELQAQLEALLAAAESQDQARADALANSAELRDMLNQLNRLGDQALLDALARALAENAGRDSAASAAQDRNALAERARRATEMASLPPGMKEALEKLADELDTGGETDPDASDAAAALDAGAPEGQTGQSAAAGGSQDLSIQFAQEAEAGGGASMLMMSSPENQQGSGPPGAGVGGGAGSDAATGAAAGIEAALKQEVVEASQDRAGANVETEIRRKTEHGDATVAFTGTGSADFDRSRAAAPPPVPEARRTDVQSYFIRKP
jgi:hypothetical protein